MTEKKGFVYILMNDRNTVIYTGVTSDLKKRVYEHKENFIKGFTKKYNVHKLVHYEIFADITDAIQREKQIKAGSRVRKMALIKASNPEFIDLYNDI